MLSKLCSSPGDTTFHLNGTNGDTLKDLKKAKNDCAQACDDKPECKYASLFWIDNTIEEWIQVQVCYLSTNEQCENGKKIDDDWAYHLYTKQ